MTYRDICRRLSAAGIEEAGIEARLLLCALEKTDASRVLADPDRDYTAAGLEDAVAAREERVPLAYLLGHVGFYEEDYEVSPACLIPRADTEILVEEAIRLLPKGCFFADLCTGSGCVAISIAAHRKDLSAVGVDISAEALALAASNAVRNGVGDRVRFTLCDLLSSPPPQADAIVCNPPYIRRDVLASLAPELAHEPARALDGGDDGLLFYRTLTARRPAPLLLYEIGFDQADDLHAIGKENGYAVRILRDLGGRDRVAVLSL